MSVFRQERWQGNLGICKKCSDLGYVIGTMRSLSNPTLNKTWKEVCPICMPTNKYGNPQKLLENFADRDKPTPDYIKDYIDKINKKYKDEELNNHTLTNNLTDKYKGQDPTEPDDEPPNTDEWGNDLN